VQGAIERGMMVRRKRLRSARVTSTELPNLSTISAPEGSRSRRAVPSRRQPLHAAAPKSGNSDLPLSQSAAARNVFLGGAQYTGSSRVTCNNKWLNLLIMIVLSSASLGQSDSTA
jgi:hypothetical protein